MGEETCSTALKETVEILESDGWMENYQEISGRFDFMQEKCTNRDFEYGQN